jgi:HEAT repeat protein
LVKSEQPLTRAGAAVVLCRQAKDPDGYAELMVLAKDPAVLVRAALAEAAGRRTDGATALLQALSGDAHVSVRCGVADAVATPARMDLHLRLSADLDSEVRRLASVRLRDYPVESVTEALLARFSDPIEAPRLAAEDSLIALKPSAAVEDRLIAEHLGQPASRASAARVLGALRVKRAAPRLREVLAGGGDHEFLRRTIMALGELADQQASTMVCGQKAHSRPDVRRAVAWALGQLAVKDTFPVLVELSQDPQLLVYDEALTSMGRIGDPFFTEILTRNLLDVSEKTGNSQRRATAAWALARGNDMPGENVLRQYEKLCLTRAIPIMGMSEFDSDNSRASCAFALAHLALRDSSHRSRAEGIIRKIADPNQDPQQPLCGLALQVFSRQALDYLNGKTSEPEPVPTIEVIRTVKPVTRQAGQP